MRSLLKLTTTPNATTRALGPTTRALGLLQTRSFGTNGVSRNLLAAREAAANRNPSSATAQNAFYQLLLKANMPAIVIERHNSGRFANNDATNAAYHQALALQNQSAIGAHSVASLGAHGAHANTPGTGLSDAQLQAVGQALAARSQGSNVAVASQPAGGAAAAGAGTGAAVGTRDGPLYVIVDESLGGMFFRWTKFILWFVFFAYLSMVAVTFIAEGFNMFKRPGDKANNSEVRAENQTTKFADVHGATEAKDELQELVDFLRNPDKFSTLGGKLPKGILLVGPPGTGKTLLARAVAGEAGVPFFYMSGSEFDEVYVGVGAKRVRDLFTSAKSKSPAIIFIDELDAIGGKRNAQGRLLRQADPQPAADRARRLRTEQVASSSSPRPTSPRSLDKALTRPGRFDRHVTVSLPDVRGRIDILKHHAKKIKAAPEINFEAIAASTSGLSGAELENIVNQAAVRASRLKETAVTMRDFEWAKDKVIMGAERKTVIGEKEKEMTAYHEAGHALVGYFNAQGPNKLYKVTILPRGQSLGHTAYLPEMDKYSYTHSDLKAIIETSLGGKLAEEIVYGSDKVTTGVSSDLQNATNIAFQMVAKYGMSDKLGSVEYNGRYRELSSETRALIEQEVQRFISEGQENVRALLTSKRKELDLLAKALVEYETLDLKEVEKVIRGDKLTDRTPSPKGPMVVPASDPLVAPPALGPEEGPSGPAPPAPPPTA
ncbi:cell division protease ftsH [Verticillium alfalfae VaMs.102]|uniref:Cell division protease ftsH n=1 Tax=Verticillium alfalfae (strain VaMs.102 / ATCC MYA-4576 / FGSC 10136) TaxID=526221 RepID=C9SAH1_VERA1|nr:cell division protease ftsH [Verticillium alfalfae VaMs.102]EEY15419.1 cell division protease ftsH [Verticillium alfalfae VaMs.102]